MFIIVVAECCYVLRSDVVKQWRCCCSVMKCCYSVMWQELCCDDRLLPADFPQHSQHSIKFRREFRQNSAGAAEGGGDRGGGRGGGSVPPGGGEQRDTGPVAAPSAAARQTASIIHVSPSSVYVIFLPNSAGGQNTAGARPPPAAKMRTKKAGSSGTADRHGRRGLRHLHCTYTLCPCYFIKVNTIKIYHESHEIPEKQLRKFLGG